MSTRPETPKFFLPHATDANEAESVVASTIKFMAEQGYQVTDRRFYSVTYTHDGQKYHDVVGKECRLVGEEVLIILDGGGMFLACTPNRGVLRGNPVLVGKHWDTRQNSVLSNRHAANATCRFMVVSS